MPLIEVPEDDAVELIPDDQANRAYVAEVHGSDIRVAHERQYVDDGMTLRAEMDHRLSELRGSALYATGHGGDSEVHITLASADKDTNPTKDVTVVEGDVRIDESVSFEPAENPGGVYTDYESGSATFDSADVPPGQSVVLKADPENGGVVEVGGSFPLSPGEGLTLAVDDTAAITIDGDSSDTVYLIVEASE